MRFYTTLSAGHKMQDKMQKHSFKICQMTSYFISVLSQCMNSNNIV